jgi:hypothetical protein
MARKGEGNQWQQPGFSVFMHPEKVDKVPCYKCVNNHFYNNEEEYAKYVKGLPVICDSCVKYNNFKAKEKGN